jgi:hypothetical protein
MDLYDTLPQEQNMRLLDAVAPAAGFLIPTFCDQRNRNIKYY